MSKRKQDKQAGKVAPIAKTTGETVVEITAGLLLKTFLPDKVAEGLSSKISDYAGKWISDKLEAWKKPADATEACREALIVAVFTAFLNKATEKKYNLVVDCKAPEDQNAIFGADALEPLKACSFDERNVGNNDLFKGLMEIVEKRMRDAELGEKDRHEIAVHIREVIDMLFWRVIEQHAERYKVYTDYFESERKGADAKHYYYKRHEARIDGLYTKEMKLPHVETLTLNDIYVEPGFLMHRNCWNADNRERLLDPPNITLSRSPDDQASNSYRFPIRLPKNQEPSPYEGTLHSFLNEWVRGNIPLEGCEDQRLLVLLGQPGQGKTSCCKRLIHDVITNQAKTQVYFIRLKETEIFDNTSNPIKHLREYLFKYIYRELTEPGHDPLQGNDVLLVLDGLDEATLNYGAANEAVNDLIANLSRDLHQGSADYRPYEHLRIVLTSRTALVNMTELSYGTALVLQIERFNLRLQCAWADKFAMLYPQTKLNSDLIKEIHGESRKDAIEMLAQPVSLFLIASNEIDLKSLQSRHDLYDNLFNELIDRHLRGQDEISPQNKSKRHNILDKIAESKDKREKFRQVLAETALACYLEGRGCTSFKNVEDIIIARKASSLFTDENQSDTIDAVLSKILLAFYLDTNSTKEGQTVEFYHRTIMEYLAAEAIVDYLVEVCEQKRDGDYIHGEEVVLGLLYVFFGSFEMSNRMSDDLKEHMLRLSDIERQQIGAKLAKSIRFLIEQEFMPKSKPDLSGLAKWGAFKVRIYDAAPWKEASRQTMLIYLALIDLTDAKKMLFSNSHLGNDQKLTQQWVIQITDVIKNIGWSIDSAHLITDHSLLDINISNINLNRASLAFIDMSGIIGIKIALTNVWFQQSALRRSELSKSNLSYSLFSYINFNDSNLSEATIYRSEFYGGSMKGANLSKADLSGSRIEGTSLEACSLKGAMLCEGFSILNANLFNSDFSDAIIIFIKEKDSNNNNTESYRIAYDEAYAMIMHHPENRRPAHPPATFEEHVKYWREHWSKHHETQP